MRSKSGYQQRCLAGSSKWPMPESASLIGVGSPDFECQDQTQDQTQYDRCQRACAAKPRDFSSGVWIVDKATQALRHQVRPQHNDHDHCGDERRPTCQTGTVRQNHARRYSSTIGCATPMRATRPGHKIDTWQTQSLKRVEASCRPQVPSPSLAETANSSGSDLKRR